MFPIRDNIPSQRVPYINYAIVAVNVFVWLYQITLPTSQLEALFYQWGLVPAHYSQPTLSAHLSWQELAGPFVTSMFTHGGWMHVIGNLWMLWIFGDNVEDFLGHGRYALFYLLTGIGAGLVHLFTNWDSVVPTVGASGAIAGVMGAYLILYPTARVLTVVPVFIVLVPLHVPALLFIGLWFVMQFLSGTFSLMGAPDGGIAWWAHIGGFVFGVFLLWLLGTGRHRVTERTDFRRPRQYR